MNSIFLFIIFSDKECEKDNQKNILRKLLSKKRLRESKEFLELNLLIKILLNCIIFK